MSDDIEALWQQAWGAAGYGKLENAQSLLSQMEDVGLTEIAALQEQIKAIQLRIDIGNAIRGTLSRMWGKEA